ncbi:hypothetical protein [Chengkuizengella marina]|uniref:Uncharacterized protein n=1 Tax=Chengkuizengella marina TaxID=2507566 RepID=A0A6N9Q5V7_9BACL|nr:hypothetical protein [Chengkuizengella marina]NBI30238.1 hypothetical protein [Chengkuizengella marina]
MQGLYFDFLLKNKINNVMNMKKTLIVLFIILVIIQLTSFNLYELKNYELACCGSGGGGP